MMHPVSKRIREIGWFSAALMAFAMASAPLHAQTAVDDLVKKLSGLTAPADLDLDALRQQATARLKSKVDAAPLRRPPMVPDLLKLPQASFEIQFDDDSPIVRPPSYATVGQIADALYDPALLKYTFLVVDHTASGGRRDANLTLSQRRADAIRDVLVSTFKVSAKRVQSLGLGEEQLLDALHPAAPANRRVQILTVGELAAEPPKQAPVAPKTAPGAAKKKHH
jgi:outer membrane protein OmpA-like peptidoglycan-associated protein